MHDLIILGGGPAGLTATVYAIRKRLDALLISRDLGGKTNYHLQLPFVEKHLVITGQEVVSRFANEIDYLEFARVLDKAEKVERIDGGFKVSTRGGNTYESKALIVATGALGQLMNVPGEKQFMMRGLCYSAISYAPLFIDRDACVIGDGRLALRATAELSRIARRVTLIAPRLAAAGFSIEERQCYPARGGLEILLYRGRKLQKPSGSRKRKEQNTGERGKL